MPELCNIEDVVNVKIITPNESLPKMRYSLDELKDLESRLILITSSKAKDRDKVDQYTDTLHSIVRIAEVLMELKHEGNVAYNEWTLECQCKANPDFDCRADLQRLATIMEQKLQQWRQELKRARDTYYALNYYTNAQLLVLRENLIKQPCPVTVLELLQSISPRVTRKDVCYCLRDDCQYRFTISVHQEMSPPVTLEKLGKILQSLCLRLPETRIRRQAFPCHFVTGSPNLIVVNPSNVLKTVLSLYMADMSSPLPVLEEVLLCDQHTNEEEALLLFRRSIGDPEFKRIFCLVHAERLSFQVADNVLKGLDEMIQGHLVGFAMIDRDKFQTDEYQLVNRCLANFHSVPVPKSLQDQLRLLMRSCGLKDPSWSEMAYFTSFLAVQLKTCEKSDFCRVIHGLNDFAVKFMIRMSRDFSTPSLHGEFSRVNEEQQQIQDEEADDILRFQIEERKKWEQSSHPYLFFNNDGHSMTFVGFIVMPNGDLVDPGREAPQMISAGVSAVNCGGLPQYPVQGMVDRAQYNAQHIEGHGYQYGMDEPAQYSMRQRMEVQQLHAYPRQGMGGQYSGQATGQVGYNHLSMPAQMRPYRYVGTAAQCIIESRIMTPNLYMDLHGNGVKFDEDYRTWNKGQMIQKIAFVMGREYHMDPDPSYALTADNLIKILAIQMRFRCGIPVVIMGESGCGKTRLIQYMCDIAAQSTETRNIFILKVHGGTTQKDITDCIENAEAWAERNQMDGLDTVVFFDEANTTEAIGLIKEIMCDRRMNGRTVSNSLKFIAACNPYRRHSDEMIAKLESAGLGFYVRTSQTQERLGKIPLRNLVYRVLELLPSMRSLVYDYGQLNSKTEADYIVQIVKNNTAALQPKATHAIAAVLSWSQQYMKEQMDECSYVSLRDVKRAMIVFDYFYNRSPLFNEVHPNSMHDNSQKLTHSLVMALAVCYHSRLNDREDYETKVCTQFKPPLILQRGSDQFRKEITRTQAVLLANMEVGLNIAHNAALRENVFMMAVCIELRIPLFLIGKPGSSKSLAKSIISSSMLGRGSAKSLLKEFKECSQHSTAESIIDVFKTAEKFQVKQDTSQFVSVVVLDEVGLAEDSPYLPLKALHPLLEDGTLDLRDVDAERVAFIGISNWALDPAKMNRGVMLTRGQPDIKELVDSAWGICSDQKDNAVIKELGTYFESLAQAYQDVCTENTQREKEFFGLRDFYSLIKMLYRMCCRNKRLPTPPELENAIRRNFSGKDGFDPTVVFKKWKVLPKQYSCNAGEHDSNPLLGMIRSSLASKESALNGESRYLLFLTENYAALKILFHYLEDAVMTHSKVKPFILFGSSFPKDNEYTQICQNVNQIKLCMETGRTAILLNLETLYESLYDALNQYYIDYGGKRYVDLGLKTHKVKCFVHQDFKLILIAEKKTVYEKFPIPLISRLEKHFVVTSSVFCEWQNDVLKNFEEWTKKMSQVDDHENSSKFTEEEAFVGYQKDTPAALIFQATNHCHKIMEQGKPAVKKAVLHESQQLLLQTVSLDAIVRVNETFLDVARSRRQLQQGGTLRNTLIRKIDNTIIPIFAHIIAVTNQYDNLTLFHTNDECSAIAQLWLAIFGDPQIVQFKYADIVAAKEHNDGKGVAQFQCQFPFFWLVKETIDSNHESSKKALGLSDSDITSNLTVQVLSSPIGAILASVSKVHENQLYESILESLGSRPSPWILAAHAVQETVECLNPPLDGNCDSESILKWLQQVQNCLVSVETILSEYPYDDITELRREWHCIRAMQMFLEHIGLKYEGMIAFAKQLYETIGRAPHFGKASTIAKVKNVLKTIDSSKIRDLEGSCHVFFIELVSQLCFGYEAPDKDLIKLLFDTIFACKPGGSILSTRKLSYKMEKDTVPVIRSCLLQLLLNFSSDTVKEYLQQYLVWSEQVIGRSESDKCQLYLLCIKCFQDTIHAKHEHKPLQERAGIASHMLEMAYKYFHSHRADNTLEYIEAVAHTRYGLGIAREALHTEVTQPECAINPMLLTAVKNVCTHPAINQLDDSTANGPIIFLLKELTKRYGMSFLKQASKRHHWLLPPQLKTTKEEDSPDMFMVYEQSYCQIRDLVADAVYSNKFQQLLDALNASDDSSFLNLALHEIVMLGWQHLKHMPKMRNVATNLLQSENNLALLCLSSQNPLHRHLLSVVVHTVVVMFSTKSTSLVQPFVTMLTNPATLVDSYMPTMPDDILSQVRSSMSGTLYVSGNATIDMQRRGDRTQRGYALPAPEKRSSDPAPERQLSAIACCLIRILMHSALFWTSNSNMLASDAVKRLMKSGSPAPQLLLSHLEKDFETLTRAIKKNELESSALVHALLHHIYISRCSQVSASQLQTSAQRSQWEQDFQSFISPVLKNMEQNIKIAMSSVLNDDKKEYGRLVYIVHEKSITDCKSLKDPKAHAWAYHPNLSIENVGAVFQAQNLRSVCPILSKFLQQEHVLRATQYIPDIFKLRQFLYIHFNHRLDRSEASSQSFGDFLQQVPAHRSTEVKVMLNSLNKAWSLCKDMFPPSVRIPEQLAAFTSKTPLEYLIPTASGAGMYTTLLLDFLVRAHNTFLEECRIVKEETGAERWPQRHIPVAYVQQLHTLDYEAQLYTIITSHCQYSLMTGQGHEVQYDFPGLEKSLVDHFIHGKPYILLEIPYVVYRRDIR
eukprot:Em0003g1341a